MPEQEYVVIETRIRKTAFGMERTDTLIEKANRLSEEFKDELWDDYSINVDELKTKRHDNFDTFDKIYKR